MATISFERDVTINPDWGAKNLEAAIDAGPCKMFQEARTPEARARFRESITLTPEDIEKLKKAYGVKSEE